jgi:broad specificity phosphatase PhoE
MAKPPSVITLHVFRRGACTWQSEDRLIGDTDLPLSDGGRTAVEVVNLPDAYEDIATIYHATDEAATESAKILVMRCKARRKAVDDLDEPALGLWQGLTLRDLAERFSKRFGQWKDAPFDSQPPEGDRLHDVRQRHLAAIARIIRRSRAKAIGVVLGPLGYAMFRNWIQREPTSDLWSRLEDESPPVPYQVDAAFLTAMAEGVDPPELLPTAAVAEEH